MRENMFSQTNSTLDILPYRTVLHGAIASDTSLLRNFSSNGFLEAFLLLSSLSSDDDDGGLLLKNNGDNGNVLIWRRVTAVVDNGAATDD